jgi:hypothetical protein
MPARFLGEFPAADDVSDSSGMTPTIPTLRAASTIFSGLIRGFLDLPPA